MIHIAKIREFPFGHYTLHYHSMVSNRSKKGKSANTLLNERNIVCYVHYTHYCIGYTMLPRPIDDGSPPCVRVGCSFIYILSIHVHLMPPAWLPSCITSCHCSIHIHVCLSFTSLSSFSFILLAPSFSFLSIANQSHYLN